MFQRQVLPLFNQTYFHYYTPTTTRGKNRVNLIKTIILNRATFLLWKHSLSRIPSLYQFSLWSSAGFSAIEGSSLGLSVYGCIPDPVKYLVQICFALEDFHAITCVDSNRYLCTGCCLTPPTLEVASASAPNPSEPHSTISPKI